MSRRDSGLAFVDRAFTNSGRQRQTYSDPRTGRVSLRAFLEGFSVVFKTSDGVLVAEVDDLGPVREIRRRVFLESPRIRGFGEHHPVVQQALVGLEQKPLSEKEIESALVEVRQRLLTLLNVYAENHSEHGIAGVQVEAFTLKSKARHAPDGIWTSTLTLLEKSVKGIEISGVEKDGRFT